MMPCPYISVSLSSVKFSLTEVWLSGAGIVGPYLIGAVKARYGGYTIPMIIMTAVNSLAVVYFAILLHFLPAKKAKTPGEHPLSWWKFYFLHRASFLQ